MNVEFKFSCVKIVHNLKVSLKDLTNTCFDL